MTSPSHTLQMNTTSEQDDDITKPTTTTIITNNTDRSHPLIEIFSPVRQVDAQVIIAGNYQTVHQSINLALNERTSNGLTGTGQYTFSGNNNNGGVAGRVSNLTAAELTISATVNHGLVTDIHTATLDTLYTRLKTNPSTGLKEQQVEEKHRSDGYNELTPPTPPSYIKLFANQLIAGFNFILWVASVLFILCWKPIGTLNDGIPDPTNAYVSIFLVLVIVISACFNTWQEISSIVIVRSFSSMLPSVATVLRDGIETSLLARELVVGDIVVLKMGEKIPADCRIITSQGLQVNNSALTGESEAVMCNARIAPRNSNYMESRNLLFYSSLLLQGTGTGVVVAIGDDTVLGQVSMLTRNGTSKGKDETTTGSNSGTATTKKGGSVEETSLHRQIRRFVWMITGIACSTGSLCLLVWGVWLYQDHFDYMTVGGIIINAISLIIAYVPEGLPVCVTLTLTLIAKRMYAARVLVRNLAIIETFNSISLIASDKTGTLTTNEMTVTDIVVGAGQQTYKIPTQPFTLQDMDGQGEVAQQYQTLKNHPIINKMVNAGILCNAARVQAPSDMDMDVALASSTPTAASTGELIGDAADTALYRLATDRFGLSIPSIRASQPALATLPFNSKNKLMITAHQTLNPIMDIEDHHIGTIEEHHNVNIYMKGAAEFILQYCKQTVDQHGNIIPLDVHARQQIAQAQQQLGAAGKRVIGVAMQSLPQSEFSVMMSAVDSADGVGAGVGEESIHRRRDVKVHDMFRNGSSPSVFAPFPDHDYIFYGLYALMDPPRYEVPAAIQAANQAGIRVVMVTGDHPTTAQAIATQCGVLPATNSSSSCLGIHTLSFVKDELNRMCIQMTRDGCVIGIHRLGTGTGTGTAKTKMMNDKHGEVDVEMGMGVGTTVAAPAAGAGGTGALTSLFQDLNQHSQSIKFHSMDEEYVGEGQTTKQKQQQQQGQIQLPDGTMTSINQTDSQPPWFMQPHYVSDRRVYLPYGVIVTGTDINVFDDYMWAFILSHQYIVFARTTPEQKLRIVQQAQQRGEIVAVTGDGTNDAPALSASDLGVSMASGTAVAREAGDLMLLDNNFAAIITAIETGRVVADNLKKVCLYLLPASTWSEMWPVLVNVFLGMPLPLYTFQMIVLSVITDVIDAMAIVHETAERAIMQRPPLILAKHQLVDWRLLFHAYIELGMICSAAGFNNFFWYMRDNGCPADKLFFAWANWGSDGWCGTGEMLRQQQLELQYTGQSIFFVSLVICNWFNMFSTRTRYTSILSHNPIYGPGRNLWLFVAVILTALVAIFVTQVSWFQTTFYTRPVPIQYVMPAFGFGAALMLMDEIRKWNWRTRPTSMWAKLAW